MVHADWRGFFQGRLKGAGGTCLTNWLPLKLFHDTTQYCTILQNTAQYCKILHMADQLVAAILHSIFLPLARAGYCLKVHCQLVNIQFSWILREAKGAKDWGLKKKLEYEKGYYRCKLTHWVRAELYQNVSEGSLYQLYRGLWWSIQMYYSESTILFSSANWIEAFPIVVFKKKSHWNQFWWVKQMKWKTSFLNCCIFPAFQICYYHFLTHIHMLWWLRIAPDIVYAGDDYEWLWIRVHLPFGDFILNASWFCHNR